MGTLWQDIKYGFRMLARSPGFTVVVVAILAVGIGATTVMLSVVDAVMLRPCPYQNPDTLVCIYETHSYTDSQTHALIRNQHEPPAFADFQYWRERNHVFEHLVAAENREDRSVRMSDRTEKTRPLFVSPGFFAAVGAHPILGRTFLPEEHQGGGEEVVILSYSHWRRWFAGDPNAIGKTLTLDKQIYTVVGVLPPDFRWIFQTYVACGVWLPMPATPVPNLEDESRNLQVLGRLKPGVSLATAQAEVDLLTAQLAQQRRDRKADTAVTVVPISKDVVRRALGAGKPRTLFLLLGIAGCVLLIACLHIASLLIARAATRGQEMAVRAALGAHRLRLIRQMLTESLLLAGLGGLLGLLLAYWSIQILAALRGQSIPWYLGSGSDGAIPWFVQVHLDVRVLLYMAGVSLMTCGLCGILPAIGASATNVSRSLSMGRTPAAGPRFQCLRAILVAADIAIAFVLLTGVGLLISSYAHVLHIEFGYRPENVLGACAPLYDMPAYEKPERQVALVQDVLQRIRGLPGVRLASTGYSPVGGTGNRGAFKIEGIFSNEKRYRMPDWDERLPDKNYLWFPLWRVSPDCFRILQVPLLRGRYFTEQDSAVSPPVAIVSEALAQRFWPQGDPIGRYITQAPRDGNSVPIPRQIVGVVATATHLGRSEPTDQEVYIPELQSGGPGGELALLVRTDPDRPDVTAAVRKEIVRADPEIVLQDVEFLNDEIARFFAPHRLTLLCLGGCALIGLVLACMGVYGTTAYAVSRRTHEIGIRMALGARRADVLKAVLRQGLTLTGIGLVIGLAGALAATRVIRSLLYDVSPTDPLTFVCVGLLLAGVALLACYLPARRAARIDPMVALRYE